MKPVSTDPVVVHVGESPAFWSVSWSAIWVGTLSALATALIIGLAGVAVGAHQLTPGGRILRWSEVSLGALFFVVVGAFFAFVVGGWVAGRIDGSRLAERSALHGAIVW